MRINFFGDFVATDVTELSLTDDVENIIKSGDINVVNCEAVTVLGDGEHYDKIVKSGPNLSQSIESADWLLKKGFDAVSLSNNHVMDYGEQALKKTLSAFGDSVTFGAGIWEDAYKPMILDVCDKKIALIGLTHCEFGTLTDRWTQRDKYGAAWINHVDVDSIIVETRKKVDFLFVFAHAGVEHIEQPLPEWRDRYRSFIDLGCDAVIASHPHIVQGWEIYNGHPIVYSLGNFYFYKNTSTTKRWCESIVASIEIGRSTNVELKVTPLKFEKNHILLNDNDDFSQYIGHVNNVLRDEENYMSYINNSADFHMENFYTMFRRGGLARCQTKKKIIRCLLEDITHKFEYSPEWTYNNIQCESHRCFFLRGYRNNNGL